jgi:hypothetical protein
MKMWPQVTPAMFSGMTPRFVQEVLGHARDEHGEIVWPAEEEEEATLESEMRLLDFLAAALGRTGRVQGVAEARERLKARYAERDAAKAAGGAANGSA